MADAPSLAGTWAYRSYLNQEDQQVFGGGLFTFETPTPTTLTGTLVMSPTLVLDLEGTICPATSDAPLIVEIRGFGRPYTDTKGWEYDYHASLAYHWPKRCEPGPVAGRVRVSYQGARRSSRRRHRVVQTCRRGVNGKPGGIDHG